MIRIQQLAKRFGEQEAVRGISLIIPPGLLVGLLGSNSCTTQEEPRSPTTRAAAAPGPETGRVRCPSCGKLIQKRAEVCEHCGQDTF